MTQQRFYLWTVFCLTALCLACSDDHDPAPQPAASMQTVALNLNLGILADDGPATRALPGDPGTYEQFVQPRYGYVYFVPINGSGQGKVYRPAKLEMVGETGTLTPIANPIDLSGWQNSLNDTSEPQTYHDSIYHYRGHIYFMVPSGTTEGRLYVAASAVKLSGITDASIAYGETTEKELLNLSFNVDGKDMRQNLQHIYATPYNYKIDDEYYGTIKNLHTPDLSQAELMLYHVAAKVDMVWNVAEAQQPDFWISFIEARKLNEYGCLLFRPLANKRTDTHGYDLTLMGWNGTDTGGSFNDDRARQWYGRQYFYTIPFRTEGTNYFDLQLRMLKNDDTQKNANDGYNLLLRKDMSRADTVFAPWLRLDLRFTNEMEYKTETRILND